MANGDFTETYQLTGTKTSGVVAQSMSNSKSFSSIAQDAGREILIPLASAVTLVTVGTPAAGATITALNSFAFRNTGATTIKLGLLSASDTVYHEVLAGRLFVLGSLNIDANVTGAAWSAWVPITSINAQASTADCMAQYEVF